MTTPGGAMIREYVVLMFLWISLIYLTTSEAQSHCTNIVPGIDRLSLGVDITEVDLLPLQRTGSHGYRRPIVDFTCKEQKKWTSGDKVEYDLPDQVTDAIRETTGWLEAEVNIMKTSEEIKRSMSRNLEVSANFIKAMFSSSGSYIRNQHTITNQSRYIEEVTSFVSTLRAYMDPYSVLSLGENAQALLNIIPNNSSANTASYREFIRNYGTHFFSYGKFGGLIKLQLKTQSDYYQGRSDSEVKAQAKATFLNLITANGGTSSSQQTVDTQFTEKSQTSVMYFGGDTNLLSSSGISSWQPSVAKQPWLFGGELIPVSNLIRDPEKQAGMIRTIEAHMDMARLRELENLLHSAQSKYPSRQRRAILQELSAVQQQLANELPDHSVVHSLYSRIYHEYSIPPWFTGGTKLCYQWYPDGDAGQCGGGAQRLLCAFPGSMTQYYRDDTDRRTGGCRMRWGIQATGYPSWYGDVNLCYRWYPDGDGGQCGGGAAREMCAPVGQYTGYYRDDTDRRSGGCQMSWKLSVPTIAPNWLKQTKLCFDWYPDGDGGQCDGGPGRMLCATANTWTAYYRDDSDRRTGGCQMSWGLKP